VRQLIGLHHDFPPDLDTALSFVNVQEVVQMLETLFFGLRIFLVAAGVITLLVGAIGVMNIMLVIVGERTQEIGLRKAVGASSRSIFLQFLAEAGAVSGISGVFGAGLGAALSYGLKSVAPPGTPIARRAELDPALIAIVVVSLVAVGIVAGVLPAVRAARIAPADALRGQ
jgi:putative ABC transport system permease protein